MPAEAVRHWQKTYRAIGKDGLLAMGVKHARYDYETKVAAASAVVDGGMSKPEAMVRFGIASATPLKQWCRLYREGGFEYLGAGWWCELAGGLLERGDQLVFGYVLGCAWLVAGGIVFAVAPPDAPLVAAASVPGFRPVPSPTAPALDFRGERVTKGA